MKELVFVSSVQNELADIRTGVRDYIQGDPMLGRYFEVFLFEDQPAGDQRPDQLYIDQVDACSVYIGLFAYEYGWEDPADGISPTEREFEHATERRKERLIFVRRAPREARHPKMQALIARAERQVKRQSFTDTTDLNGQIQASLIRYLERRGILKSRPFAADVCPGAGLADIDPAGVTRFLHNARARRNFGHRLDDDTRSVLTHLNLMEQDLPLRSAVLLFGTDPQRFIESAETKCLHFHGTEVRKGAPSYQIYRGDLTAQAEAAVDFVLSKLDLSAPARERGAEAVVAYEIPPPVVSELVINAIAHRDYAAASSVQVILFADRLEVWNPGELPPSLTPEQLRRQHPSVPRNPRIAEILFLAGYIEKAGTGTLDVIAECRDAGLPEPDFRQDGDQFVATVWRDWLTAELLDRLGLNERQRAAMEQVRRERRITTAAYAELTDTSRATAKRDLEGLVTLGLIEPHGSGRGAHYVVSTKRLRNGSNGSAN
jgi:predicted HTH transcriptional regulator